MDALQFRVVFLHALDLMGKVGSPYCCLPLSICLFLALFGWAVLAALTLPFQHFNIEVEIPDSALSMHKVLQVLAQLGLSVHDMAVFKMLCLPTCRSSISSLCFSATGFVTLFLSLYVSLFRSFPLLTSSIQIQRDTSVQDYKARLYITGLSPGWKEQQVVPERLAALGYECTMNSMPTMRDAFNR
jgi:hypothetical protein